MYIPPKQIYFLHGEKKEHKLGYKLKSLEM